MKQNRLVIFDFDGTLCATHEAIIYCIQRTFEVYGEVVPDAWDIQKTIGAGITLDETINILHPTRFLDSPQDIAQWVKTYREIYNGGEGGARTFLFEGVINVFENLTVMGIPIVLVSNKGSVAVMSALERFGIESYITLVVSDTPNVPKKPDPAIYRLLINPMFPEISTNNILVVGDTLADLIFARNIGAQSCWASYGYGIAKECLQQMPDVVIEKPQDVISFCGSM